MLQAAVDEQEQGMAPADGPAFWSNRKSVVGRSLPKAGVFLVSLGSPRLTPAIVEQVLARATADGVALSVYLLDSPERGNLTALHGLDETAAADRVEEQCLKFVSRIPAQLRKQLEIRRVSDLFADTSFLASLKQLRDAFEGDKHFAAMCENQVFVNLQPVLRRLGARNRRDPLVRELCDYLLVELALKIFLNALDPYEVEYGIGPEMRLWQDLVSGKVPGFPSLGRTPVYRPIAPAFPEAGRLTLDNITFYYDEDRRTPPPRRGLLGVSLSAGGVFAILGPSGSFKTTLLKIVAGHLVPSAGGVHLGGTDVTHVPAERRRVATVFQDYALFPHLTGLANVLEGGRLLHQYSKVQRRWLAGMYLRRLNIAHCAERLPKAMSGGEQQRVAIARSLMAEPAVLLLDEPTAALDTLQRDALAKLIVRLSITSPALVTLIVSHDRDFVLDVADSIAIMDEGRVLATGDRSQILSRPPTPRVAEILGTHSVVPGILRHDGVFMVSGQEDVLLPVRLSNPPAALVGCRGFALVRHDGLEVMPAGAKAPLSGKLRAIVGAVVDRGSTIRAAVYLSKTCELALVMRKSDLSPELREGNEVDLSILEDAVTVVAAS